MNTTSLKNYSAAAGFILFFFTFAVFGQTPENTPTKRVNFGYSQNPKTKVKKEEQNQPSQSSTETPQTVEPTNASVTENGSKNETIAKKTLEVVKKANKDALVPTESYKVGSGDVLFINLQNSSKDSSYFTILNDGTIDYPLAGQMVQVSGLTTDEIEDVLREKIKLFENPQITVKVRDYSSHKITVLGLVEKSGDKFIQREAIPLFVVRAEAIVQPKATRVVIRRGGTKVETYELKDDKSQNLLVFPNDIVEFSSDKENANGNVAGFIFIGGEIVSGGQKDFHDGLTLTQAILVSGGLKKDSIKKVVIRRKNADGLLVSSEFNLKQIKDGKTPDPVLQAGDTIEIGN